MYQFSNRSRMPSGISAWAWLLLLLIATSLAAAAPAPTDDSGPIAIAVSQILEKRHYARRPLEDSVSSQWLQAYIESWDSSRLNFLQSDVDEFQRRYATRLDELTKSGDVRPAYEIFARYLERVEQRVAYAKSVLKGQWNFDENEYIIVDRRNEPWPVSESDAKRLWRQRVKYEVLQERLNKKSPEEIVSIVARRYDKMLQTARVVDSEAVLDRYLTALALIYDPHSDYMPPSSFESYRISRRLKLTGIGVQTTFEDEYPRVSSITPGGPASLDGRLKVNDHIIAVAEGDGPMVDLRDLTPTKIMEKLRGDKGTVVRLLVAPADAPDPSQRIEIKLVRDEVKLVQFQAKARLIEFVDEHGKPRRYGLIELPSFYEGTTRDVRRLLEHLKTKNIEGLLFDIRNNGGGSMNECIALTGLFIKEGPVVLTKNTAGSIQVGRDPDRSIAYDGPMIVLTNRTSASASEIFAGALQDYGRAVIVGGKTTFGKGTVQATVNLTKTPPTPGIDPPKWGAVKVTTAKFYRVSGGSTQHRGVIPDIQLPSLLDHRGIGESARRTALPYDEVTPVAFTPTEQVSRFLPELQKLSAARVARNLEFKYILEDIDRLKMQSQNRFVSLNESERLAQRNAEIARAEARKSERAALRKTPPFRITDVALETLATVPAPTQTPAPAVGASLAASAASKEAALTAEPDPVLEESLNILADLIRLSGQAAR